MAEGCAIARAAAAGELEAILIHEKPTDVLANQIVGLEMDFGEISREKAHRIVTRAYPFRDLLMEEMNGVITQMEEHRLVRLDGDVLQRTRKAREYYIENLSMIPDEKRYNVYDIVGRRSVGTLDEAFVISFAQPGATFVTKGEIWEITEIGENEIKVVPIHRSGEIPSWTGEEIPVPFAVAQEVGSIRREIRQILESEGGSEGGGDAGNASDLAVAMLQGKYPLDGEAAEELVDLIKKQMEKNLPVPDESHIVVESGGEGAIINACFGHKTNDTLGRVITSILSARFGSSVALQIDPYRIELTLPKALLGRGDQKAALGAGSDLRGAHPGDDPQEHHAFALEDGARGPQIRGLLPGCGLSEGEHGQAPGRLRGHAHAPGGAAGDLSRPAGPGAGEVGPGEDSGRLDRDYYQLTQSHRNLWQGWGPGRHLA